MVGFWLALAIAASAAERFDVVVYGGTAGGVSAAVAAAREGVSVALVEPGRFLGGLTACGVAPDAGARPAAEPPEFYIRVGNHYGGGAAWNFEPHVATLVLWEMLEETGVAVFREQRLRKEGGVRRSNRRIRRLIADTGVVFEGSVFVDATYEGDLMAFAGVAFRIAVPEAAESPAYSFPLCLTPDKTNQIPYPKPDTYNPDLYSAFLGYLHGLRERLTRELRLEDLLVMRTLPNRKTLVRTRDNLPLAYKGAGSDYLEAGYLERVHIWQVQLDYTAGLFYFLAHDPRVPDPLREAFAKQGLCADEFAYSNHWAHQLFIRQRRLMVGDTVLTWRNAGGGQPQAAGTALFRGKPFDVPFRVLAPRRERLENLLVVLSPAAGDWISASLRDERVSIELGTTAGKAAARAVTAGKPVQDAF